MAPIKKRGSRNSGRPKKRRLALVDSDDSVDLAIDKDLAIDNDKSQKVKQGKKEGDWEPKDESEAGRAGKQYVGQTNSIPFVACEQLLPMCTKNAGTNAYQSVTVGPRQFFTYSCGTSGRAKAISGHYTKQTGKNADRVPYPCLPCQNWRRDYQSLIPGNNSLPGSCKEKRAFQPHSQKEIDEVNKKLKLWLKEVNEKEGGCLVDDLEFLDMTDQDDLDTLTHYVAFKAFPELPDCVLELAKTAPVRLTSDRYPGTDFLLVRQKYHAIDCPCGNVIREMITHTNHQAECRHVWVRKTMSEFDMGKVQAENKLITKKFPDRLETMSQQESELELQIQNWTKTGKDKKGRKGRKCGTGQKDHQDVPDTVVGTGKRKQLRVIMTIKVIPIATSEQVEAFNDISELHSFECANRLPITCPKKVTYTDPLSQQQCTIDYNKIMSDPNGFCSYIPLDLRLLNSTVPPEDQPFWIPELAVRGYTLNDCFETIHQDQTKGPEFVDRPILFDRKTNEPMLVCLGEHLYDVLTNTNRPAGEREYHLVAKAFCYRHVRERPNRYEVLMEDRVKLGARVDTKRSKKAKGLFEKTEDPAGKYMLLDKDQSYAGPMALTKLESEALTKVDQSRDSGSDTLSENST